METTQNSNSTASKKRLLNLAYWAAAWTLSIALVTFGSKYLWNYEVVFSVITIIISTILGIGLIMANIRFLNQQDELQRKIALDAMAFALGVAIIGGLSFSLLDTTNVIPFDAQISHVVILSSLSYLLATLIGNYRYK